MRVPRPGINLVPAIIGTLALTAGVAVWLADSSGPDGQQTGKVEVVLTSAGQCAPSAVLAPETGTPSPDALTPTPTASPEPPESTATATPMIAAQVAEEPPTPTRPPEPVRTVAPAPPPVYVSPDHAALLTRWFPGNEARWERIISCESGWNPGANTNPPYIGLAQVEPTLHANKVAQCATELGLPATLYNPEVNLCVASIISGGGWQTSAWPVCQFR